MRLHGIEIIDFNKVNTLLHGFVDKTRSTYGNKPITENMID